jgi:pimeloyl-ACP methyl ester carboxylesterase
MSDKPRISQALASRRAVAQMKHFSSARCAAALVAVSGLVFVNASTSEARTIEVNILYVHGVQGCDTGRQNAHNSLVDLENAMSAELPSRISAWQTAHSGDLVVVNQQHANLYTATPSPSHPSNSMGPLFMDDWEVGDPGCTTTQQGDPCTTAYEWRYRLVREINRLYPSPAKNIILVGHSTGGRVAMEVAANVGTAGVNTFNWGVQSRIAGVVTVHGMIDSLGTSKYDARTEDSFETSCKGGELYLGWFGSCALGNGWCEYAGRISGFDANDWVAKSKRAMNLISWADCSTLLPPRPSAFLDYTDGVLPFDAQGGPWSVGLEMTPTTKPDTWRVAHGQMYGSFCHSDITDGSSANHAAARDAVKQRILDWLFIAAPRVAATGTNPTATLAYKQTSSTFTMGSSCPTGEMDDTWTAGNKTTGIDIAGVCKHGGLLDGDDHPVALGEVTVTSNGTSCNGAYNWKQAHDSNNSHMATLTWKTRSLRVRGPDLINSLP